MFYRFGRFELDPGRLELVRDGRRIGIQPKPLALLLQLLERHPDVPTKRELQQALWPDVAVTEFSLRRAVRGARRALGEQGNAEGLIRTVHGTGYAIGVPVEVVEGHPEVTPEKGRPADEIFVGREALLEDLESAFDGVRRGRGALFLLAGEAGIGKTHLAQVFAARAEAAACEVLWGRCLEGEGAPPFWPWTQILRAAVHSRDPGLLRKQLGAGLADLATRLPELREALPDRVLAPGLRPEQRRFRFFDSASRFLVEASLSRPTVLVLDDLHHADIASLRLLCFLAPELAASRLLVVGTYRPVTARSHRALHQALAELARLPHVRPDRQLPGLSRLEVGRYAAELMGRSPSEELVEALWRKTEGHPFFLREVMRGLQGHADASALKRLAPPESVRAFVDWQLDRLSKGARDLVTTAAVVGREASLSLLAAVLGLAAERLLEPLEELEEAALLEEVPEAPGVLRFPHALVPDSIYRGLCRTRRTSLHRRVGEALETMHGGESDKWLPALAHQFAKALPGGDSDKAIDYARRAAEQAMREFAFEDAARHFETTLQLLAAYRPDGEQTRARLLLDLAEARFRGGEPAGATEARWQAIGIARRIGAADALAEGGVGLATTALFDASEQGRVIEVLEEAREELGPEDGGLRARVVAALGRAHLWRAGERGDALSQEALGTARTAGEAEALHEALATRALFLIARPGSDAERSAIHAEWLRLAKSPGHPYAECEARLARLRHRFELAEPAAIDRELAACERLARKLRQPPFSSEVLAARAARALWRGELAEAERIMAEAAAAARRVDRNYAFLSQASQLVVLRRLQGRSSELLEPARSGGDRYPMFPAFRASLALLLLDEGCSSEAEAHFEELAQMGFEDLRRDASYVFGLALLSELCARLEDAHRAERLAELLLPHARRYVTLAKSVTVGCTSRYLGLLCNLLGRFEAAERHFDDALAVEQRMGARPWEAYARCDYARMLVRRSGPGDSERAAMHTRAARVLAAAVGMRGFEQRAGLPGGREGPGRDQVPSGAGSGSLSWRRTRRPSRK